MKKDEMTDNELKILILKMLNDFKKYTNKYQLK
jgi:hypothetical protein